MEISDEAKRSELFKKIQESLNSTRRYLQKEIILNKSTSNTNSDNSLQTTLNNTIESLESIKSAYQKIVNLQSTVYENFIGISISKYYYDAAYKVTEKLNKTQKLIDLISDIDYDEFQYRIANDLNIDDFLNYFNELKDQLNDIDSDVVSDVETLEDNTNGVVTKDASGSLIKSSARKLVRYAAIKNNSISATVSVQKYAWTMINNNPDIIYISNPYENLSNTPMYRKDYPIKFWFMTIGKRVTYLSVINPDDEDERVGITCSFKNIIGTKSFNESNIRKVVIKKGYYVFDVTASTKETDTEIKNYIPTDSEGNAIEGAKEADYPIISINGKRYILTEFDRDGENVEISSQTSKVTLCYDNNVDMIIKFDKDSFDPTNEDILADNVELAIGAEDGYSFDDVTLESSDTSDNTYKFTGNLEYGAADGYTNISANNIPMMLKTTVTKDSETTDKNLGITYNKYKLKIGIGINPDETAVITKDNAYYAIGLLAFPDSELISKTVVTDSLDSRAEYLISYYLETMLNLDDLYGDKDSKLNAINSAKKNLNKALTQMKAKLSNLVNSIGTFVYTLYNGETVRSSLDSDYDKTYYDDILTSSMEIESSISSATANELNETNLKSIINSVKETWSNVTTLFDDSLDSITMLDEMIYNYSPLFGDLINFSKINSSANIAFNVFEGKTDYSATYNYNGTKFISISVGTKSYSNWFSNVSETMRDNSLIISKYYLLVQLNCRLSKMRSENFKDYQSDINYYLRQIYKRNDIDKKIFSSNYIKYSNIEKNLYDTYGLVIYSDLNYGNIPTLLTTNINSMNKFNNLDLNKFLDVTNGNVINIAYLRLQMIISLFKSDNVVENIILLSTYLNKKQNLRSVILALVLNDIIDSFSDNGEIYSKIVAYKTDNSQLKSIIKMYLKTWSYLYSNDFNVINELQVDVNPDFIKLLK